MKKGAIYEYDINQARYFCINRNNFTKNTLTGTVNVAAKQDIETQPEWFSEIFEEEPKETIKIGKVIYDKNEFEKEVKDLKPIK